LLLPPKPDRPLRLLFFGKQERDRLEDDGELLIVFASRFSIFLRRSAWVARSSRSLVSIRTTWMFTITARSLLRALESMTTPYSVKASGGFLVPP
jgi:hypothetical protein